MKLLIASDIHGAADACASLVKAIEAHEPDRVVLLGDLLYHGPRNDLPDDYAPKRVIAMLNARQPHRGGSRQLRGGGGPNGSRLPLHGNVQPDF